MSWLGGAGSCWKFKFDFGKTAKVVRGEAKGEKRGNAWRMTGTAKGRLVSETMNDASIRGGTAPRSPGEKLSPGLQLLLSTTLRFRPLSVRSVGATPPEKRCTAPACGGPSTP